MKPYLKYVLPVILQGLLTACGGGGGGTTASTVPNAVVAGAWQGTSSTNYTVDALVLPSGHFYTIFGAANASGGLNVVGFDSGTYSVSGNNMTGSLTEYEYTGTYLTGDLAATVTTGTSLVGTVGYSNNTSSSYTATPISTSTYNFATPANLANITGNWSGEVLAGIAATATISSSGAISATGNGCLYTGTLTPDATNNFFNLTVTSGSQATCGNQNTTYTGVAVDYAVTGGHTQLLMIGENTSLHAATAFFAVR